MTLHKKLAEKRDLLAAAHAKEYEEEYAPSVMVLAQENEYKEAFNAACNLLLPEIEKLEKALFRLTVRLDESASIHDIKPSADIVRQALQSLREFWGEDNG